MFEIEFLEISELNSISDWGLVFFISSSTSETMELNVERSFGNDMQVTLTYGTVILIWSFITQLVMSDSWSFNF